MINRASRLSPFLALGRHVDDVQSLCDRVIILHKGEVRYADSAPDCCAFYHSGNPELA